MPADVRITEAREVAQRIVQRLAFPSVDWDLVVDDVDALQRVAVQGLASEDIIWVTGIHNGATYDIAAPRSEADDAR